jgi:uncharacterized membrane protein YccC
MRSGAVEKWWHAYRVQLRFCARVTVAAISALLIAQFFALPLHGLWVVLTATVITQLSVGGSLGAGLEYFLGTLGARSTGVWSVFSFLTQPKWRRSLCLL